MSIKITQAAIEAGARALRDHYQWTWMNLNCIEVSAKALEAALPHLQDCKVSPQTVQSTPATATQVAIDDEEVERVAMAIHDAFKSYGVGPWSSLTKDHKNAYMSSARAAIRAIREGGKRWGVWCNYKSGHWYGRLAFGEHGGQFVTTDREAATKFACLCNSTLCHSDEPFYEVRPYPGEREKTAEERGKTLDEVAADVVVAIQDVVKGGGDLSDRSVSLVSRLCEFAAAIRDAKETTNG